MFKKDAQQFLRTFGWELRRIQKTPRNSLKGVLLQLQGQNIQPTSVIDVGAAFGSWSTVCFEVFPHAAYCLIEPLSEYENALQQTVANIPHATYHLTAISSDEQKKTFFIHSDLVGSSFKEECEPHTQQTTQQRTVPCRTIDGLCEQERLTGPYLLKLDIQGAELDALAGAQKTLQATQAIVLEVSLLECMKDAPLIADVIDTMRMKRFVVYYIFGHNYRPIDNALTQVDMVFVPISSALLSNKWYADEEQRKRMNQRFQKQLKERGV